MNRLVLLIAIAFTVFLAGCTVTFLPDESTAQSSPPVTVRPKPVDVTPRPVQPVQPQLNVPQNQAVRYICSTASLSVRYSNNYTHAEVFYDGSWNQLPERDRSTSGVNFANGTFTWAASGRDAYLIKNGTVVADNCYYTPN